MAFSTKIKGHHHLQGNVQVYNVRTPVQAKAHMRQLAVIGSLFWVGERSRVAMISEVCTIQQLFCEDVEPYLKLDVLKFACATSMNSPCKARQILAPHFRQVREGSISAPGTYFPPLRRGRSSLSPGSMRSMLGQAESPAFSSTVAEAAKKLRDKLELTVQALACGWGVGEGAGWTVVLPVSGRFQLQLWSSAMCF